MIPTHVTVIPSAGHSDDSGKYTRGRSVDTTSEVDIVDQYTRTVSETLEEYGISFKVMETRKAPGVKESERPSRVDSNSMVLELAVGWFETNPKKNRSEIYYYSKKSKKLAAMVADAIGDWGRCTSYEHVTCCPKEAVTKIGNDGIRVEPFALNGPNYADYLPRMASLGRALAMSVIEFIKTSNPSAGYHPFTVEKYKAANS